MNEVAEKGNVAIDLLEALGFEAAAYKLKEKKELKRKMALAYEHYRYVTPEKLAAFNEKLKKETLQQGAFGYWAWKELLMTPVKGYEGVPPASTLKAMQEAKDLKCFDAFQVASIRNVKDPILFGRVDKCPDLFFIAQWDDDVKIQDILKDNEG